MPARSFLEENKISPEALTAMTKFSGHTVKVVQEALKKHDVVVVGMAQNPYVKTARRTLENAKINFHYLEYGSYFSQWRTRLAIKLWSGWPTFPQIFVKGVLIGGSDDTSAYVKSGQLQKLLGQK